MEWFLALKTNELIISFVLNNVVLLLTIQYTISYIFKRLGLGESNFFKGLIDLITNKKLPEDKEIK